MILTSLVTCYLVFHSDVFDNLLTSLVSCCSDIFSELLTRSYPGHLDEPVNLIISDILMIELLF
jgi:hypothetical protein